MQPIVADGAAWPVCLSVGNITSPAKTAEWIKIPFGRVTLLGPRNHVLDGSPRRSWWQFGAVVMCWSRSTKLTYAEPGSGFDSKRRHFILVCNQPPRSTQPSTLRGTVKRVPAKGWWCSVAREQRQAWCNLQVKLWSLSEHIRGSYNNVLNKLTYTLLLYFTKRKMEYFGGCPAHWKALWVNAAMYTVKTINNGINATAAEH